MSFFAFGVFSVSGCLFVSTLSLVSEDDDEDVVLTMAVAVFAEVFCGGVNEKSPSVLMGVVLISSQSVPTSLPLRFNKSDNDGFLFPFPFLLRSVPEESFVVVFALDVDPDELEG